MKQLSTQKSIKKVIWLSLIYLMLTFLVPKIFPLLWVTALFIIFNYSISLVHLFFRGTITISLVILNLIQLALFCRLHVFIHDLLGSIHYIYTTSPNWYDWVELMMVHILRAVDLLDILGAYGIHLQNLKHQSNLAGFALFNMHIMVDIFLLGAIFTFLSHRSVKKQATIMMNIQRFMEKFGGTFQVLKQIRFFGLLIAIVLIINVGIINSWHFWNWIFWPLDNILRTVDFGDAFQIFNWQLHSLEMGFGLATLAVFFRLVISLYAYGLVNRFYFYVLGGRGKTIEELIRISTSSEYSEEERSLAFKALTRFGTASIPYFIDALLNHENADVRRTAAETLEEMGKVAVSALPSLIKASVDVDGSVRRAALLALRRIDLTWHLKQKLVGNVIVSIVEKLLNSKDADIQNAALYIIKKSTPSLRNQTKQYVVSDLEKHKIEAQFADETTAKSPAQIEKGIGLAVLLLIKALVNRKNVVRQSATLALEQIEPYWWQNDQIIDNIVDDIVNTLIQKNQNREVQHATLHVLAKLTSSLSQKKRRRIITQLESALIDIDDQKHLRAISQALKIVEQLTGSTMDIEDMVKGEKRTILDQVKALNNSNGDIRWAALEKLEKISGWWNKEFAHDAIPYLLEAQTSRFENIREVAEQYLRKIDPSRQLRRQYYGSF